MILVFTPEQAEAEIGQLSDLLIDAVDSGASVGFMPPLIRAEADAYWRSVIAAIGKGAGFCWLRRRIAHDRLFYKQL